MQFVGNCHKCGEEIRSGVNAQAWRTAVTSHQCPDKGQQSKLAHKLEKSFLHSSPRPKTPPPGPKGKRK